MLAAVRWHYVAGVSVDETRRRRLEDSFVSNTESNVGVDGGGE